MEICSSLFLLAILISNIDALITDGSSKTTKSVTLEEYNDGILPNLNTCGVVKETPKIVGGIATTLGEMPWIAGLEYTSTFGENHLEVRCMGSLVHQRYVLTAASCAKSKQDLTPQNVILGDWNSKTDPDCINSECANPVQRIKIRSIIFHQFNSVKNVENDIALIRLENDAVYSEFVSPICLPRKNLPFPEVGQHVTVAGWGQTLLESTSDILLKVNLPIVANEACGKKLNKEIKDNRFCAGDEQKDACAGDGGSPAIAIYGDDINQVRWYQRGIVSFGKGCGIAGFAGVYTKVDKYMDWIITNIQKDQIA